VVGPPGSAPPYSAPPQQSSGGSRGPWIPLLAVATALFLLLSIVMSGLFFSKSGQHEDTRKELAASETKVSERDTSIKDKDSKISALQTELDSTKQQLTGTKSKVGTLTDEKAVIGQCLKLVFQFIEALAKRDTNKANGLINQLRTPCNRAQAIVGS
jgi:septal ring factor EnvC (AmiA/AmiB activator)